MASKRKPEPIVEDPYIDTDLLIVEVEVRPILYTPPDCSELDDKDIRMGWAEVAHALSAPENECIKTWTKLVKTFRHFRDVSSSKMFERWTYYEQMQFIAPYINEPLLADDEAAEEVEIGPAAATSSPTQIIEVHRYDEDDVEEITNAPDAFTKYECPMDNEDMFLLSFAPNLTRLSAKQNGLARLRILDELYKLEFDDD